MSDVARREFFTRLFRKTATTVADTPIPSFSSLTFPKRQLGNTGEWVPILGIGTAAMGRGIGDDVAAVILNRAVDAGVSYVDTAPAAAGYGRAQLQVGRALSARRKEIFLCTAITEANAADARRQLEQNLQELRTDHADLLLLHDCHESAVETLLRAKEQGITRFIGFSATNRPDRMVRALADHDVDVAMTTINFVDAHTYGFEKRVWPFAHRKGVGLVAMKVFGGVRGRGHRPALLDSEQHEPAFRYALGLTGCACAVVGMTSVEELDENVRRARAYSPLTEGEQDELLERGEAIAAEWGEHFGPS